MGLATVLAMLSACKRRTSLDVREERDACETCHRSVSAEGVESGIETAHGSWSLSCVDCHGGDPDAADKAKAHDPHTPEELHGKSAVGLTQVPASYVRFVNPADLRVAPATCAAGAGAACHDELVSSMQRSLTATFAGALTQPRRLLDPNATAVAAVDAVDDADGLAPGAVPSVGIFPHPIELAPTPVGRLDQYLRSACARCHIYDFGSSKACGDMRSSGCAACHVPYDAAGASSSADAAGRPEAPAARTHEIVRTPEEAACARCHIGGARIALAFRGRAPVTATGYLALAAPASPEGVDACPDAEPLEDVAAGPDAHAAAGMTCTDCHVGAELHGSDSLYASRYESPSVRCTDCHGTAGGEAEPDRDGLYHAAGGWVLGGLRASGDTLELRTGTGAVLSVPQIVDADAPPQAHGDEHASVACASCHSKFTIRCIGCHVTIDEELASIASATPSLIDAQNGVPAALLEEGFTVDTASFVLGEAPDGTVYPIVPAQGVLFSHIDPTGTLIADRELARDPEGLPAVGFGAIEPHTVGPSRGCDDCHIAPDGSNRAAIERLVGAAATEDVITDGAGEAWDLGRLLDDQLEPIYPRRRGRARALSTERARSLLEVPVR
jgi:hypothetical protein